MTRIDEWLDRPDFRRARFSSLFRVQLDELTLRRVVNPFQILEEIKALEGCGVSRTKRETPFRKGPLAGLMHKHYFSARQIVFNVNNYWARAGMLERAISKMAATVRAADGPWTVSGMMANRLVDDAIKHKTLGRSLTGDWIVYKRHNGRNFYLTLAAHNERSADIYGRLAPYAAREFPELGIALKAQG
jgi:hypothetical protein